MCIYYLEISQGEARLRKYGNRSECPCGPLNASQPLLPPHRLCTYVHIHTYIYNLYINYIVIVFTEKPSGLQLFSLLPWQQDSPHSLALLHSVLRCYLNNTYTYNASGLQSGDSTVVITVTPSKTAVEELRK